ncbi:hypothetical protein ElyMa_006709900 [Elysia marginata]|uniref:Uncharacterized protein n=1 Tax=Elysia marginata TaxID=1093978 RepID=A0AAV4IR98_9GAST|nr:hypothetical protein ElyMa_006709900 [Elysia marginata]
MGKTVDRTAPHAFHGPRYATEFKGIAVMGARMDILDAVATRCVRPENMDTDVGASAAITVPTPARQEPVNIQTERVFRAVRLDTMVNAAI